MSENICYINCAGLTLKFSLIYAETMIFFKKYLISENDSDTVRISVTPEYMKKNRWIVNDNEKSLPYLEYNCLMLHTGNELLQYGRALFHGVCFIWKGRSWILTAPSGTGKTTQMRLWNRQFRKEMIVVNGDKPAIECRTDGSIWAYSSPWEGKERIGKPDLFAPLGGIILLEQGSENIICRMSSKGAAYPLFKEFVSFPETTEQIRLQGKILDQILSSVPVWKLINKGDLESAQLTHKTLTVYLEANHA